MEHPHRPLSRIQIWGIWVIASCAGYTLGAAALYLPLPLDLRQLVLFATGATAQWLVLRSIRSSSIAFVPATAIASVLAFHVGPLLPPHRGIAGIGSGALVGLAQAACLALPGPRMGTWLGASVAGGFAANLAPSVAGHLPWVGPLVIGGQAQIEALLTGIPLALWYGTTRLDENLA